MPRNAANVPPPEFLTLPQAARHFGLGLKLLRAAAKRGEFPLYDAQTHRRRAHRDEIERWLRSTRVRPTDHARARVDEVRNRERPAP